jgi:two-component system CheB/CheR fusion protein
MLTLMAELLTMQGARVTTAQSGAEAVQRAGDARERFHLVISDIGMPGMDGCALLAELRNLQATAMAPAIALSGFTRGADVDRALGAGFITHVRKPVALDQLLALAGQLSE